MRNAIDRFCYKHPKFGVPNLMLFVMIGQVAVLLFYAFFRPILPLLAFNPDAILHGQVWRLFTFVLIPNTNVLWFIFSFIFYTWVARSLEHQWGTAKFTVYYLIGASMTMLVGWLLHIGSKLILGASLFAGAASGLTGDTLHMSLFLALATLAPESQIMLFGILPIKMKWLALFDAAYIIITPLQTLIGGAPGIALVLLGISLVSLANYFLFFGLSLVYAFFPKRQKRVKNIIKYKQAAQPADIPVRSCAICGKTSADPTLEFRYCSVCTGMQCYCNEHIYNHEHC